MARATSRLIRLAAFASACLALTWAGAVLAAGNLELQMETHAAFFSSETTQPRPLDPQVFVRDTNAAASRGPQGIEHSAGFRPAVLTDPASSDLFNAQAKPLGFTLGDWLGAKGSVDVAADGRTVTVRVSKLRPNASYSLFENHFDQQPIGFTPLDGSGRANSFIASAQGDATVTVTATTALTHANAVLLVYHSDNTAHGVSRGEIGVNAHHQLIARIP